MLGMTGARILRTNLVVYDGIMDIPSEATELIHILGVVKKPCNSTLLCQWVKLLQNGL